MKYWNWIKTHKLIAGIGGIIIIILGFVVFGGNGTGDQETVAVTKHDVIEQVRVSGTVEAQIVSDIGFETGGIVRNISVAVNDTVYAGQHLASVSLGTLPAELKSAEAAVAIKRAQMTNTGTSLDTVREKQDTLVANAYSELLSEGLVAEAQSPTYRQLPPTISGRYTGDEGTYKLNIKSATQSGETDLYVFGMEDIDPIHINKTGPTPIGTTGLFVDFPAAPTEYEGTIWYIEIPNTNSASYAANYSAYQAALRERERALDEAEAQLRSQTTGTSIAAAELAQAEAEVARINALIRERMLIAPFAGVITAVDIDLGESVSAADRALSLISNDGFGVEIDIPEIDSIKVRTGNPVAIELEAVSGETFPGSVVSVNRTETVVDGVSVYEARVAFENPDDERIMSGMTADVSITTNEKRGVLALPARAIKYRTDGTTYVLVADEENKEGKEVEVALGLRGSDGFVEITAGLAEGDMVIAG